MRRLLRSFTVLISCLLFYGCSKPDHSSRPVISDVPSTKAPILPPREAERVWFTPDDLLTDVGSTPILLSFQSPPPDEVVELIRSKVEVRTYPGRVPIPFQA